MQYISFGGHQSQTIECIKALNDMYNCISIISEKKELKTLHISNFYTDRFPEDSKCQMPDNQTVSHCQSFLDQKNDFNFLALVQSRIE